MPQIITTLSSMLNVLSFYIIFNNLFIKKSSFKKEYIVYAMEMILSFINTWFFHQYITYITLKFIIILLQSIIYTSPLIKKVIISFWILICSVIIDLITFTLFFNINKFSQFVYIDKYYKIAFVSSTILLCLFLIADSIIKLPKHVGINNKYQLNILPCTFAILLLLACFTHYFSITNELQNNYIMLIIFFTILVNVLIVIISGYKSNSHNTVYKQYNELFKYTQELSMKQSSFAHNLANALCVVSGYIKIGMYDKAQQKLNEICNLKMGGKSEISTGLSIIDTLIEYKYNKMNSLNIKFICLGRMSYHSCISDFDLCIAIGNALDNAIEACSLDQLNNDKHILMSMYEKDDFLSVQIVNTIDKPRKIKNNCIKTTKLDKGSHGIGLESIKNITNKYNGETILKQEGNLFYITMTFSIK